MAAEGILHAAKLSKLRRFNVRVPSPVDPLLGRSTKLELAIGTRTYEVLPPIVENERFSRLMMAALFIYERCLPQWPRHKLEAMCTAGVYRAADAEDAGAGAAMGGADARAGGQGSGDIDYGAHRLLVVTDVYVSPKGVARERLLGAAAFRVHGARLAAGGGGAAEISAFATEPDFHHCGNGRLLWDSLQTVLRQVGVRSVALLALAPDGDASEPFWQRRMFARVHGGARHAATVLSAADDDPAPNRASAVQLIPEAEPGLEWIDTEVEVLLIRRFVGQDGRSIEEACSFCAACVLQGMWRMRVARAQVRVIANSVYRRIYDEEMGTHFYFNTRSQTSRWTRPQVLPEINTVFSDFEHRMARTLQDAYRMRITRRKFVQMLLDMWEKQWDGQHNMYVYINKLSGLRVYKKPRSLRGAEVVDVADAGKHRKAKAQKLTARVREEKHDERRKQRRADILRAAVASAKSRKLEGSAQKVVLQTILDQEASYFWDLMHLSITDPLLETLVDCFPGNLRAADNLDGKNPLHNLCLNPAVDRDMLERVVDGYPEACAFTRGGYSPLQCLCLNTSFQVDMMDLIINTAPFSVHVETSCDPALYLVCANHHVTRHAVERLITVRPKSVFFEINGETPVHRLVENPAVTVHMLRFLVESNPQATSMMEQYSGRYALHRLCTNPALDPEWLKLVLDSFPQAACKPTGTTFDKTDAGKYPIHNLCGNVSLQRDWAWQLLQPLVDACPEALSCRDSHNNLPIHYFLRQARARGEVLEAVDNNSFYYRDIMLAKLKQVTKLPLATMSVMDVINMMDGLDLFKFCRSFHAAGVTGANLAANVTKLCDEHEIYGPFRIKLCDNVKQFKETGVPLKFIDTKEYRLNFRPVI
eukprot:g131.t1